MSFEPLFTTADLERFFDQFQDQFDEKILTMLTYCGEAFVKRARMMKTYKDRTGNLRSSIGYVIVQDGSVIKEDIRESEVGTDRKKGVQQAKKLCETIAEEFSSGWVLIGVAGMDYALYVENLSGKDVISSSAIATETLLREIIQSI
jgi:hypothetical protein